MKIKDLRPDQVVWESEKGCDIRLRVKSAPARVENREGWADGWEVEVEDLKGGVATLFQSDKEPHYGPKLYSSPQYI